MFPKRLAPIILLFLIAQSNSSIGLNSDGLCQGNHFLFLSTYILGRQQDLTKTFEDINKTIKLNEVVYEDTPYRTYRIFNISQSITYL